MRPAKIYFLIFLFTHINLFGQSDSNLVKKDSSLKEEIINKKNQLYNVNFSLDSLDKKIKEKNRLIQLKEKYLLEKNLKIKELSEQNKTYLIGFRWVAILILLVIAFFLFYGIWNFKLNKKIPSEISDRFPQVEDPFIKGIYRKYITYLKLSRLATMLLFLFVTIAVILFSYIIIVIVFNNNFDNVEILINNKFWDFILASGFPLAFVTVVYNTVETKRAEVENFIMDKIIIRNEEALALKQANDNFIEN